MFPKVRNIQRNILEGSGVQSRRGTMRHWASWAPPWPAQGRGEESPSKSDWWRWTPTPPPPRRHKRGEGESNLDSPPWPAEGGGVHLELQLPPPPRRVGGRSPTWTPTPSPSRFGGGLGPPLYSRQGEAAQTQLLLAPQATNPNPQVASSLRPQPLGLKP